MKNLNLINHLNVSLKISNFLNFHQYQNHFKFLNELVNLKFLFICLTLMSSGYHFFNLF